VASQQDRMSAKSCAAVVCEEGYNWFDFVCAQGDWIEFYSQISDMYESPKFNVDYIVDHSGITKNLDYCFQKEYKKCKDRRIGNDNSVNVYMIIFIISFLVILFVGSIKAGTDNIQINEIYDSLLSTENDVVTDTTEAMTENTIEKWKTPAIEEFSYEVRDGGIVLTSYEGNDTSLIIPDEYELEGDTVPVLGLDGCFADATIKNIALSDGIEYLANSPFDNCRLDKIYIPLSVSHSLYNLENNVSGGTIYFEGSLSEWNERDTFGDFDRSNFKFDLIVYNASYDEFIEEINIQPEIKEKDMGDYTPLSEFIYSVTDEGIVIKQYLGEERDVKISDRYIVDNKEYQVIKLENVFALEDVDSVVVGDGIVSVEKALFNSCGVKRIYLPASLENVPQSFWNYLHDIDCLYYGGTKEQFEKICSDGRWKLDVKHTYYECNEEDITKDEGEDDGI
jgi:hypothetical protein